MGKDKNVIYSTQISRLMCLSLGFLLCLLQFSSKAQEETVKRVPAKFITPAQAGILLGEGREDLEQPSKTLNFMGLRDGDIVAEIGCGNGYYTLQVAPRIAPHGAVFAVDVQQGMLDLMQARREEAGIKNVYPILGTFDDPMLPPGKADWILLVDAYHEFSEPEAMLARMKESLAPGGRVALLEYRAEQDPATIPFPIPRDHKMSIDEVMREWVSAGFELVQRAEFLPAQHLFVFKAAGDERFETAGGANDFRANQEYQEEFRAATESEAFKRALSRHGEFFQKLASDGDFRKALARTSGDFAKMEAAFGRTVLEKAALRRALFEHTDSFMKAAELAKVAEFGRMTEFERTALRKNADFQLAVFERTAEFEKTALGRTGGE